MTACPHCKTEHSLTKDWPCHWSQERRERFARALVACGVGPGFLPAMAAEVEKLMTTSIFLTNEDDLIAYFTESAGIGVRVSWIEAQRERWLAWSKPILAPFRKVFDNLTVRFIPLALCLLIFIGLPMLILTAPIRIPFAVWRWWVARRLHPTFVDWLKAKGKKKY